MTTRIRACLKGQEGASAVEFALIVPVLLLLIFGIIEFGLMYHDYLAITHAAREGARKAAVNKFESEFDVQESSGLDTAIASKSPVAGQPAGSPVSVTVTYTFHFVSGYLQSWGIPGTIPMKSTATMSLEQPGN